jgi:hypothetical protein
LLLAGTVLIAVGLLAEEERRLDPAAWGTDHVGQELPPFTSGDECLFCHRMDVGPTWEANRHGQTIRVADPQAAALLALSRMPNMGAMAGEVELLLGRNNRQRFLKRGAEHGSVDLLSVQWCPSQGGVEGRMIDVEQPRWDSKAFGRSCAGCHATAVDAARRTFAALSLDCFVCHAEVAETHTTKGSQVLLSPRRSHTAAEITSICAQCHVRTGKSRSTGLPYPNQFVAGDNLFRDFQVDLADAALEQLNPAYRHVQENVRDVVLLGRDGVTCLSCHDVHQQSSRKHHGVAASNICRNCHTSGSKKERVAYQVHSAVCGY